MADKETKQYNLTDWQTPEGGLTRLYDYGVDLLKWMDKNVEKGEFLTEREVKQSLAEFKEALKNPAYRKDVIKNMNLDIETGYGRKTRDTTDEIYKQVAPRLEKDIRRTIKSSDPRSPYGNIDYEARSIINSLKKPRATTAATAPTATGDGDEKVLTEVGIQDGMSNVEMEEEPFETYPTRESNWGELRKLGPTSFEARPEGLFDEYGNLISLTGYKDANLRDSVKYPINSLRDIATEGSFKTYGRDADPRTMPSSYGPGNVRTIPNMDRTESSAMTSAMQNMMNLYNPEALQRSDDWAFDEAKANQLYQEELAALTGGSVDQLGRITEGVIEGEEGWLDKHSGSLGLGLSGLSMLMKLFEGKNKRQQLAERQMNYTSPYEIVPYSSEGMPAFAQGGIVGQQTPPLDSLRIGLRDAIVNSIDDPNREGKNSFVPSMLKAYDELGKFGGDDVPAAFAQGGVAKDNKIPAYAQGGVAGQPYIGGPTDGLVGEAGLEWVGDEEDAPIRGQALFDLINIDNPMAQFYNGGYAQNRIPAMQNGSITLPQAIRTSGETGGSGNITNEFKPPVVGSEEWDVIAKGGGQQTDTIDPIDPSTQVSQGTTGAGPSFLRRPTDTRRSLQFREHHETLKEMLGSSGQSLGETSGQMAYGRGMAPLVMQSQWQDFEQDMRERGMSFDQIMQWNRFQENQRQFAAQADLQAQTIGADASVNYNRYGAADIVNQFGNMFMLNDYYRS